jgi:type I restriction enzyme M protein
VAPKATHRVGSLGSQAASQVRVRFASSRPSLQPESTQSVLCKRSASERPWTERLWVYDLRTNQHFTLKQNPLRREHLQDFVDCYLPGKVLSERVETERFHSFSYDELVARDRANLDITWLRDDSLEDLDNLPAPGTMAREIVEDLTAALAEFEGCCG